MDWPTATVIVGVLGTICTAILKIVPKKLVNGEGERYAKAIDVVELRARIPVVEHAIEKESKYVHDSIHELRNKLATIAMEQALMKQTMDELKIDTTELLRHMRRRSDDHKKSGDRTP